MAAIANLVAGGALIGSGAALLVLSSGRIAGVSGVVGNLLEGDVGPQCWRIPFLVGLLIPAIYLAALAAPVTHAGGVWWLAAAGLLVGFGTRLGSGCTSGHGVCGIANFSRRSLVATLVFMTVAMLTVFVVRHLS